MEIAFPKPAAFAPEEPVICQKDGMVLINTTTLCAKYDGYNPETGVVETSLDARAASRKASNFINLQKGNYRKNPTDELKQKLAENYALVINPTEKMTNELIELGIIDCPEQEEAPAEEQAAEQEEAPAEG